MSPTKQVVLVTGASTGFGRLIAETMARNGYEVFATMRNLQTRNAKVRDEYRDLATRESLLLHAVELDVTDDASVEAAVQRVFSQAGRMDILVNNAGHGVMALSETVSMAQAHRQFETNFFGVLRMVRSALPAMKQQGSGLLIHISSGAGRLAIPGMGLYCASKFALEALAETLRYELASQGIDSVILEPGAYRTEIMAKLEAGEDQSRADGYGATAQIPQIVLNTISNSRANPQEVADAVLRIVQTTAGQRSLRYRVGPGGPGVERINALTDEVQAQLLDALDITHLTTFTKRSQFGSPEADGNGKEPKKHLR